MARQSARSRKPRASAARRPSVRTLLVGDALRSWLPPTAAVVVLAVVMLLDAIELIPDDVGAAISALALLVLGAFLIVSPLLADDAEGRVPPLVAVAGAIIWIAVLAYPFEARVFAGAPIGHVALDPAATGAVIAPAGAGSRVDVVVDLHLPMATDRRDRTVHYDVDLTDDGGTHSRVEGELGDSWRMRRMGRRGTAPSHIEHLSTSQVVATGTGALRLAGVTLVGEPGASAVATAYPHRLPPDALLYGLAILLCVGALVLDRWWDPRGTATATMVTTAGCAAALVFAGSGSGHPGVRDVIGAALVGAVAGVTIGAGAAWLVRTFAPGGTTARRAA